jgi:GTP cyclohydrolase I
MSMNLTRDQIQAELTRQTARVLQAVAAMKSVRVRCAICHQLVHRSDAQLLPVPEAPSESEWCCRDCS